MLIQDLLKIAQRKGFVKMPEQYGFYLRGILNSIQTYNLNPSRDMITEEDVSGEYIALLRVLLNAKEKSLGKPLEVGDTLTVDYDFVHNLLNLESIYDKENTFKIESMGDIITTTLGTFTAEKKPNGWQVRDTYDFEPLENTMPLTHLKGNPILTGVLGHESVKEPLFALEKSFKASLETMSVYPLARYFGGVLMPEEDDGSAKDSALTVQINVHNENKIEDTILAEEEYSDDSLFAFEGPMSSQREEIFNIAFKNIQEMGATRMGVPKPRPENLGTKIVDIESPTARPNKETGVM
tara:strand:+ start:202 stop:1089 length:888 start_codon:yes stop_codon:yes gene_type:complete